MERRRAADGQPYTAVAFVTYYGAAARQLWENAPKVWQAPDSNWYTEAELQAWQAGNTEQAPAAPAAEQHQAAENPTGAAEPAAEQLWGASGNAEQAPAAPAAE